MTAERETSLCRYRYDPLDRVVGCTPLNRDVVQRFYRKNRLATEVQGQVQYSVFEHDVQLLAQRRFEADSVDCALLATDLQRSVLHSAADGQHQQIVYSPYGHRSSESGLISLLGFNGERQDPVTGHYLLGNGYRAFNPVLMRFNSPDSLSPFGKGGVNAYAYCLGDPVNWVDPMGEFALFTRGISRLVSVSISAGQEAGKGLRVMKKAVMTRFSKTHATKVTEAMAKADESKIYQAGAEYRFAAKQLAEQETRRAKFLRFAAANQFPDDIQYKGLEKYQSDLHKADQQLRSMY
jgi:RHS repeat-associated protein